MKNIYIRLFVLFLFFLTLPLASFAKDGGESSVGSGSDGTPVDYSEQRNSVNKIGLDFLREALKDAGSNHRNTMVSPVSAYAALSLLHSGLTGNTLKSLDDYMQTGAATLATYDSKASTFLKSIMIDPLPKDQQPKYGPHNPVVGISNSAWANHSTIQEFEFSSSFLKSLAQYSPDVFTLDFTQEQSATRVNQWASDRTYGLIPKVIDPDQLRDLSWVLMNALYVEASWADDFYAQPRNPELPFHLLNGKKVEANMIKGSSTWSYFENAEAVGLEIPFHATDITFYMIMPKNSQKFAQSMVDGNFFSANNWASLMEQFKKGEQEASKSNILVTVSLPKFSFPFSMTLKQESSLTKNIGLNFLFDRKNYFDFAPLGGLTGERPGSIVNLLKQDTKVQLDEKGVKAAAVTTIGGNAGTGVPNYDGYKEILVDRPFVFALISKATGAALFLGTVVDPTQE